MRIANGSNGKPQQFNTSELLTSRTLSQKITSESFSTIPVITFVRWIVFSNIIMPDVGEKQKEQNQIISISGKETKLEAWLRWPRDWPFRPDAMFRRKEQASTLSKECDSTSFTTIKEKQHMRYNWGKLESWQRNSGKINTEEFGFLAARYDDTP